MLDDHSFQQLRHETAQGWLTTPANALLFGSADDIQRTQVVRQIVMAGRVQDLSWALARAPGFSDYASVRLAVESDHPHIVAILMPYLLPTLQVDAVITAADMGRLECLEVMRAFYDPAEDKTGLVLILAAESGQEHCFPLLQELCDVQDVYLHCQTCHRWVSLDNLSCLVGPAQWESAITACPDDIALPRTRILWEEHVLSQATQSEHGASPRRPGVRL